MRTRPVVLATVAALLATGVPSASAFLGSGPTTVRVAGEYLRDPGCLPTGGAPTADPSVLALSCAGAGLWQGDLAGRTATSLTGRTDLRTRTTEGRFSDVLHTTGGRLTVSGTYTVDPALGFRAQGRIVDGTCAYEGASGSLVFTGSAASGRWSGTLARPVHVQIGPCLP